MKKLVFVLVATLFAGAVSNAQSAPKNFTKIDLGLGKVSSYAGPCVDGSGFCAGSLGGGTTFDAGISKLSDNQVSLAFSNSFYQKNIAYLRNGLQVDAFSLPRNVSDGLGIAGEFVVAKGTYAVTEKDGYYFVTITRQR
ncbi:hypothetical protein [Flavobacterium caeni]|uniref:Uncharacterized protein n=1 Tax=Flavobacterium caeni TaxID=490189 RepID=A0A1G5HT34_9FLAO|nr:hypothetical protein [Flavobacterium caeni]SCY66609.1 hypothetical protein SAMN02927903_01980 [Flavobacterium caeni]